MTGWLWSGLHEECVVGGVGYIGISANRGRQPASISVLEDFTDDISTISAGNLFQKGIA